MSNFKRKTKKVQAWLIGELRAMRPSEMPAPVKEKWEDGELWFTADRADTRSGQTGTVNDYVMIDGKNTHIITAEAFAAEFENDT